MAKRSIKRKKNLARNLATNEPHILLAMAFMAGVESPLQNSPEENAKRVAENLGNHVHKRFDRRMYEGK